MHSLRQLSSLTQTVRQQRESLSEVKQSVQENQKSILECISSAQDQMKMIKEQSTQGLLSTNVHCSHYVIS